MRVSAAAAVLYWGLVADAAAPGEGGGRPVTYGSHIILEHKATTNTLFSTPSVQWNSGEQVVSAVPERLKADYGLTSLGFVVRSAVRGYDGVLRNPQLAYFATQTPNNRSDPAAFSAKSAGTEVACGDAIKLSHAPTERILKADTKAAIGGSGLQILAGGAGKSDVFVVECSTKNWRTGVPVRLKGTNGYLATAKQNLYTSENCPKCPIRGHSIVSLINPTTRQPATAPAFQWVARTVMAVSFSEDELDTSGGSETGSRGSGEELRR